MASLLNRDLIFLILQFLDEEKFKETVHKLEQESGLFFNLKYFEDLVLSGKWDEVEKYLSGFTRVNDNRYSMKIYFEIRKQKYLEALDRNERATAVDILVKDLKLFAEYNEDLYKEITQLLTLENFRENEQLSGYKDIKTARTIMYLELKKLIEANPLVRDKLLFPNVKGSRLRVLINQSLNWQHSFCENPRQNPDIRTLFVDHNCRNSNDPYMQLTTTNQLIGATPKTESFPAMGAQGPSTAVQLPLTSWMVSSATITHPVVSGGGIGFGGPMNPAAMVRVLGDSDTMSRTRISGVSDKLMMPGNNSGQNHRIGFNRIDELLPKTVARTLTLGSMTTSMDFHPIKHALLLVGSNVGDISLWEVSSGEKLLSRNFQATYVSVRRVLWSPNGAIFGVAYSKHIVQLYTYHYPNDIQQPLEIHAHVGGVNDLAFSNHKQLCVITCGDDKTIKVWDVASGIKLHTFEGHEDAVYSVCPHSKDNVQFVFSTSVDGKIRAWLYEMTGSMLVYDAPGRACATMAYSADGRRLFSCGTNREGESHIVEWNENEGTVKRSYQGFNKPSSGIVQFDTTKNRFLAAGDDYSIKFWDMDSSNLLTAIDADGSLPATPRIRFNKDGSLLAVSANENRIKILATVDSLLLMHKHESHSSISTRTASDTPTKNGDSKSLKDVKPKLTEEVDPMKIWKLPQISEPTQCCSLRLSAHVEGDKISRLIYNNSGTGILALSLNAILLFWRWPRNELNSMKATTKVPPQLYQPASGSLMTNDLVGANPEAVPCFALSKNDSYLMSASGGKISLVNVVVFKTMARFMAPPPAATYIAFHPQDNNVIAVGMDDSTIHIYNARTDQLIMKLKGHSKRITGLAFSNVLKILVASGADAQIIVWRFDKWELQKNTFLHIPPWRTPVAMLDTEVQFHHDQIRFLAVNETQIAIYDSVKLECVEKWDVGESSAPVSHATFSCDSQLVYGSFLDGTVRIFNASNLQLRSQINSSAYITTDIGSKPIYPLVIAAHPQEPNQFAIGLSDGSVHVFEPLESEGKWGVPPPLENGSMSSIPPPPPVIASDRPRG